MSENNPVALIEKMYGDMERKVEHLEESLSRKLIDLEDVGWTRLYGQTEDKSGLSLSGLTKLSANLRDQASTNPLHKRGAQLRHAYVFGRGINFGEIKPGTQKAMDDPYNLASMFSVQAHEANNLALFTDGNLFVIRDEKTQELSTIPIDQMVAVVTDPDDSSKIRYLLREWTYNDPEGRPVAQKRWYALSRYKKAMRRQSKSISKSIKIGTEDVAVSQTAVIYHHTTQRQVGWTFGIPDSLAASVWAIAYSEYLRDNAGLVKALQQIAWAITTATKGGQTNAATSVAGPGVGGTAVMGSGNALAGVGVPSAQVNFNNGQPLGAMVATSFGVPVIALLSSPGATGGSYGAATTLDGPTIKGMKAVQDSWTIFYRELLQDMGSPKVLVSFPALEQDPAYREVASVVTAYEADLLHQDEARQGVLDLLDVPVLHKSPPEKTEKTTPSVAGQGQPGAVAGGQSQGDTDHSGDDSASSE